QMKKTLLIAFLLVSSQLFAQLNISLRSNIFYGQLNSNIGGYVDHNGREYALLGWWNGLDIIDVTNPDTPVVLFTVPGAQSEWREVKTYRDYAYVTTEECCAGLQIVDLSNLPNSYSLTVYQGDGAIAGQLTTIHALHIDTAKAFLYLYGSNLQLNGANGHGHPIFLDISDPLNPVYSGVYLAPTGNPYVHDGYVENDTAYFGHIYDGYVSIVDVSDKSNPVLLATQQTPNAFTHNIWLSDNHKTMFTTDETTNSFLAAYDISDLTNITELSRFQTDPGSGTIVHNTHIRNDFAITSWYTEGVVITDVSRPKNPIEVGHYDTYPANNDGVFDGDWGVYPFLPSGNLLCSDMSNGFFVLTPTYVRGCYLEGLVTDTTTAQSLDGVAVTILAANVGRTTNITGHYYSGLEAAGTYDVQFSKNGYVTKTFTGVNLANGVLTVLDAQLVCINCVALTGQVLETGSNNPIPNAQIVFSDGTTSVSLTSDGLGNFSIANFIGGTYDIVAGAWGYRSSCQNLLVDVTTSPLTISLDKGYYDDFALDFGWTHTSATHDWERAEPVGTISMNHQSNPDFDISTDCIDQCYVTDNGGGAASDHDVDPNDGTIVLTSPVFDLSTYIDPQLSYYHWFFNGELNGNNPNDELTVKLSNGISTVTLETVLNNDPTNSTWALKTYNVASLLTPTANMHLSVETFDIQPSSIVEGGLDGFEVTDNGVGINEAGSVHFSTYPNPFTNQLVIAGNASGNKSVVEIYNSTGEKIVTEHFSGTSIKLNTTEWAAGIYIVRLTGEGISTKNITVSKTK
ncbi:MAG: choice-of-anchor B family protein, partial [Bacteroidota bacterium]